MGEFSKIRNSTYIKCKLILLNVMLPTTIQREILKTRVIMHACMGHNIIYLPGYVAKPQLTLHLTYIIL